LIKKRVQHQNLIIALAKQDSPHIVKTGRLDLGVK